MTKTIKTVEVRGAGGTVCIRATKSGCRSFGTNFGQKKIICTGLSKRSICVFGDGIYESVAVI
jgi:hypothetical protein